MPIEYDVKQDAFYKEGVEDGRKRMENERKIEKRNLIKIKTKKHNYAEIPDLTDSELFYDVKLSEIL